MPEIHLRQPGFTYSPCRPCSKNKERIQKFKGTWDSRYIYQKELHKPCFQNNMAYGDFRDLTRRTVSDKILRGKHLILPWIQNVVNIKGLLPQCFTNFFIKIALHLQINLFGWCC